MQKAHWLVPISARIKPEEKEQIKQLCHTERISLTTWLSRTIRKELAREK